ncbi:MAG: DNA repair protein RadA [Rhodothermales bacterium]|nr:DNA repair protein RadA [Rhodothermales bacterium]
MAKTKTRYVCQVCSTVATKWMGQCAGCGGWNTLVEELSPSHGRASLGAFAGLGANVQPVPLSEVAVANSLRLKTGITEFDRVLGGGIVQGSLVLLAGDPGIGKSTLMTVLGQHLRTSTILYVTGEESPRQVKVRADRLGVDTANTHVLAQTDVEAIAEAVQQLSPDILVVDSIQTLYRPDLQSAPGSVSQVRESAATLLRVAKALEVPTFLIGHVTKAGSIAGPRVLEHMVDTVLHLEGDRHHSFRILRAVKNRFGSTNEIGIFEMSANGLREVENPSELFLADRATDVSGSAVVCSVEGTRPVLVEIQSLVTQTSYATPQRAATGFDARRLQMLLAVLEKREGFQLSGQDVFVNVAGGVRLDEPATDMGVIVAVATSFRNVVVDRSAVFLGEVGLGGEIRSVNQIGMRLREAAKLGFNTAYVPSGNDDSLAVGADIQIRPVGDVSSLLESVLA